jgi:hypothetical protein
MVQKTEEQLFILNSWWEQKTRRVSQGLLRSCVLESASLLTAGCNNRGGNIDATLVDAEEKRALAQATGLDLQVLEYWLGNTRKKARKQAAAGYM